MKEIKFPELEDLLKAGCHFGHRASAWNPRMDRYIYDKRNGVHIIDLISTMKLLKDAVDRIASEANKGSILIVGTKGQAASLVEKIALETGTFYIDRRWPGGLFTNFKAIKKSVDKLLSMEENLASGAKGMVKKEQLMLEREVERLNKIYKGIKFMESLPSLVIVVDSMVEKNTIREARIVGIPVVALLDTNCNPDLVNYPIPANDDSIKSIELFLNVFAQAIKGGTKAASLVTMRESHMNKLRKLKEEFELESERTRKMEEEERERLKALREGKEVVTSKIRVVKAAKESETFESLGLPSRVISVLKKAGITKVDQVRGKSKEELVELPGVGEKAADEILKVVI